MPPKVQRQGWAPSNLPRLAAVLALASIALGGSTVYLARSLHAERARQAGNGVMVPDAGPPSSASDPGQIKTDAGVSPVNSLVVNELPEPALAPQPTPAARSSMPDMRSARLEDRMRGTVEELSDPARRAQRVADMRAAMQSTHEELFNVIGLQPQEAERALDAMAEASIDNLLVGARCHLTPGCDLGTETRKQANRELDQLERSVGREVVQRILDHDSRRLVDDLVETLPQGQELSADQIERLTESFTATRRQWSTSDESTDVIRNQLELQAAAVLTAEQLRAFNAFVQRSFDFN